MLLVALLAGEGLTNREAAARLIVSPKTIEYHLANAYRKLGVRSRVGLARRWTELSATLGHVQDNVAAGTPATATG